MANKNNPATKNRILKIRPIVTKNADYLRRTGKPELNPRGIQRDLTLLLENPKLGSKAIRRLAG
ncbi:MAG: hypothetical protein AB4206_05945 [Xenococcaceae cyanobacterium]